MTGNPLVAAAVDHTSPFAGTLLVEDGEQLVQAVNSGDWVSGGMAAFSGLLDTAAAVSDPLGSLIAAGLGWLIDHVEPLKGWFNDLTGNAAEVQAFAQTWANIHTQMEAAGTELHRVLGDVDDLAGQAIDAYRRFQQDTAKHLTAAGTWAGAFSTGLNIASMIVQAVHDLVRDVLSQLVGSAISWASEAVFTLGLATPWIIEQVSTRVASWVSKVGKFITRLLESLKALRGLLDQLKPLLDKASELFGKLLHGKGPGGRDIPDEPKKPSIHDVRNRSSLSDADLESFLRTNYGDDVADAFAKDGTIPDDVQIPKDPSVLTPDGKIDWSQVPKGGYKLDGDGDPIKQPHNPQPGEVVDRYGPSDGRYTSPVPENGPYTYDQRSLPYVENPNHYHQYEFNDDLNSVKARYDQAPPDVQARVDDLIDKGYYSFGQQASRGPIADGFGVPGQGVQDELPLPVDVLIDLGILSERTP
ncbi:DUF4237 domain-containing protein [Microbacterium protaetiae]|uniref:DUF4237 domain-containing protein n=1 Tax=Microbacterium protaetiae TaxID=2509458 RepID=A0A4P6EEE1_9MICO|nr:TNT domain-containing protein [Microbacterium protaetiae]QAY60136.1 DUF4237 domain-containing protein [Microbacterium protaetiae]